MPTGPASTADEIAEAVRALTLGGPAAGDVIVSIAWSVGLIAIFGTIWRNTING